MNPKYRRTPFLAAMVALALGPSGFAQDMDWATKITEGPIATQLGYSIGCAWGDYDNDGFLDLFVSNESGENNSLWHNQRDGTFALVTSGPVVTDGGRSRGCSWGDYDNDGFLDLFVANVSANNFLYRNNGDGTFTKVTSGRIVNDGGFSNGATWGDYDSDGFIDLIVANHEPTFLYRNKGDGTFDRVNNAGLVEAGNLSVGVAWGDYDNDGLLDLFVANGNNEADKQSFLYRNLGNGSFERITEGRIATDASMSFACAWGDYDNDGFLDLFLANNGDNALFHNNGDGTFTKTANGNEGSSSLGCAWGDYDNDGFLDLFAAGFGSVNYLFHNNGDGTFTRADVANEAGDSIGCAWGDYNNDGFLDLFVANGIFSHQSSYLYRNNGNSNHWMRVRCVGSASNRSALGTKVRLRATIGGSNRWQLRQISSGDARGGNLDAHFGLGDASIIDTLRIEWPSGTVQEFRNLSVNQRLTFTEPPSLKALERSPDGAFHLLLTGAVGYRYDLETSSNLVAWTPWLTVTSTSRTIAITDTSAANSSQHFYRAVGR
jgi:hypothetical protein